MEDVVVVAAEILNIIDYKEGKILDFIHKHRPLLTHNRKEMYRRNQGKKNKYSRYMEKIYKDGICILCEEEKIDDREHYNSCNFSKHNWDDIESQVKEIMEKNKI